MYWSQVYPGSPEQLAEVQRAAAGILGDRDGADLAVSCLSELWTNALLHTASGMPGGKVTVHVALLGDRCQVRVDDEGGPGEPYLSRASDDDEGGRGLAFVDAVSCSWRVIGDHYGRAVLAEVSLAEQDFGPQLPDIL